MLIGATMFSGIGAPETAMPHWRWPWHAEIEKFPSAVLGARHPESINMGDVGAEDFASRAAAIARPNVLIFGSPCQSYSIAGKRLGLDDPRGNLALTALGIVDRLKPDWFVFENVPGLFSSWSGEEEGSIQTGAEWDSEENSDFVAFLSAVDDIGYSGAWTVLDAQYRGVAQRRDRVFFVGHSRDWRAPSAVLLEPESLCGNSPPSRDGTGRGTPIVVVPIHSDATRSNSSALTPSEDAGGRVSLRDPGSGIGEAGDPMFTLAATRPHAVAFDTTQITSKANRSQPKEDDPCHPLAAQGHPPAIVFNARQDPDSWTERTGPLDTDGTSQAVAFDMRGRDGGSQFEGPHGTANIRAGSGGSSRNYIEGTAVRRLTPRECERLQGFPDDYTLIEYRGKAAADGPRYKALGNSMAVPVMRLILSRIEMYELDVRAKVEAAA